MANKVLKPCKICGKMFIPCADCESVKSMFRWRRVACSAECAKEYFAKVEKSRQSKTEYTESQFIRSEVPETTDTPEIIIGNANSKKSRKRNTENKESEQID